MNIEQVLEQLYTSGMLSLSIMALAISIMVYPTIKHNLEKKKK
jgi:hypothetical protein